MASLEWVKLQLQSAMFWEGKKDILCSLAERVYQSYEIQTIENIKLKRLGKNFSYIQIPKAISKYSLFDNYHKFIWNIGKQHNFWNY